MDVELAPAALPGPRPVPPSSMQEELEEVVCCPLATPIIRAGPRLCRSRTLVSIHSLRRSGRLAAKSRASNATALEQRILLIKLGIPVHEDEADLEVEKKFKLAFGGNMSGTKQKCLQLLLNRGYDVSAMDLNLDGLGEGMA